MFNHPYYEVGRCCSKHNVSSCNTCLRRAGRTKRLVQDDLHLQYSRQPVDSGLPVLAVDDNDVLEEIAVAKTRQAQMRPPLPEDLGKKSVAPGRGRAGHKAVIVKTEKKRSHHQKSKGKDEHVRKERRDLKFQEMNT